MIYIAHRGNLAGPNSDDENKPEYLLKAINAGFYVETDLWLINSELFLGHHHPQYKINIDFLVDIKDKLYCHCKNIDALPNLFKLFFTNNELWLNITSWMSNDTYMRCSSSIIVLFL